MTSSVNAPSAASLKEAILRTQPAEADVRRRLSEVQAHMMARSATIREANFTAISPADLNVMFEAYDQYFFGKLLKAALGGRRLSFRLSRQMTKAGGKTTRFVRVDAGEAYEIALAIDMLFDAFRENDRSVAVGGVVCESRVEALQRIFEHELAHLVEMLCWGDSDCAAARFQGIASRLFLHQTHTHELITRAERAAGAGIRVGSRVSFALAGARLTGRVNRVTRRATVLVPDPEGRRFSDGLRYRTYYVPLTLLEPGE
jgi:hypothetical protein